MRMVRRRKLAESGHWRGCAWKNHIHNKRPNVSIDNINWAFEGVWVATDWYLQKQENTQVRPITTYAERLRNEL